MITLVINGKELPKAEELVENFKSELPTLKSVVLNTNCEDTNVVLGKKSRTLFGDGYITDELCSLIITEREPVKGEGMVKLLTLALAFVLLSSAVLAVLMIRKGRTAKPE
jgi:hypothetical protein